MNAPLNAARWLLVDGSNLLFQMFYGMPSRIVGRTGRPIHGTLGFCGALLKILRTVSPTHVLVLFDGEHENERRALYAEYKANRPDFGALPEEETPFSQLPDICAALELCHILHGEAAYMEADDLIASYTVRCKARSEVVICSMDSDFFQLIDDRVSVFRYRGDKSILCTSTYVTEKFGILPNQYADWKSLVGDHSDHIKGVPGIGPKTAARLLSTYGDLIGILESIPSVTPLSIRHSLEENTETLLTNRKLIGLDTCLALPFPPEECTFTPVTDLTTRILLGQLGLI